MKKFTLSVIILLSIHFVASSQSISIGSGIWFTGRNFEGLSSPVSKILHASIYHQYNIMNNVQIETGVEFNHLSKAYYFSDIGLGPTVQVGTTQRFLGLIHKHFHSSMFSISVPFQFIYNKSAVKPVLGVGFGIDIPTSLDYHSMIDPNNYIRWHIKPIVGVKIALFKHFSVNVVYSRPFYFYDPLYEYNQEVTGETLRIWMQTLTFKLTYNFIKIL